MPHSLPCLVFLHGFLGSCSDWDEMISHFSGYQCIALAISGNSTLESLHEQIEKINPLAIVGYSMGGRIAMQLNQHRPLIILSSHLGLTTQKEREERWQIDSKWAEKILSMPLLDFLEEWYSQPIFTKTPEMIARRSIQNTRDLAKIMLEFSLAKQPLITQFPKNTLFIHGEKDLKYAALYRTLSSCEIPGCSHAVHLEKPKECAEKILKHLEGCYGNT